jgi:hypothetical protein
MCLLKRADTPCATQERSTSVGLNSPPPGPPWTGPFTFSFPCVLGLVSSTNLYIPQIITMDLHDPQLVNPLSHSGTYMQNVFPLFSAAMRCDSTRGVPDECLVLWILQVRAAMRFQARNGHGLLALPISAGGRC